MEEVTIVIKAREDGAIIVNSEVTDLKLTAIIFSMAFDALRAVAESCPGPNNTIH